MSRQSQQCVAMAESGPGSSLHHDRGPVALDIAERATDLPPETALRFAGRAMSGGALIREAGVDVDYKFGAAAVANGSRIVATNGRLSFAA